jgi:hypothetical protein
VFVEPRGRGKGEGKTIYLGRGVSDCVEVFQDEALAVICPLADSAPLNKR